MTDPQQPSWSDPTSQQPPAPDPSAGFPPPVAPDQPTYAPPGDTASFGQAPAVYPGGTEYPPAAYPPPPPPPGPYGQAAGYGQQPYNPYGQPLVQPTNGLAIAAMIVAIVGFGPIGAIMGHMARKQIRERNEQGDGFALAGIIVGWITTGIWVLCCGGYALALAGLGIAGSTNTGY